MSHRRADARQSDARVRCGGKSGAERFASGGGSHHAAGLLARCETGAMPATLIWRYRAWVTRAKFWQLCRCPTVCNHYQKVNAASQPFEFACPAVCPTVGHSDHHVFCGRQFDPRIVPLDAVNIPLKPGHINQIPIRIRRDMTLVRIHDFFDISLVAGQPARR